MNKYVIEREIPGVGALQGKSLQQAAARSNAVLDELGADVQWLESFIAADKMFCIYLGTSEEIIRKHAELSGFPATKVFEISKVIDPTTGNCTLFGN